MSHRPTLTVPADRSVAGTSIRGTIIDSSRPLKTVMVRDENAGNASLGADMQPL